MDRADLVSHSRLTDVELLSNWPILAKLLFRKDELMNEGLKRGLYDNFISLHKMAVAL